MAKRQSCTETRKKIQVNSITRINATVQQSNQNDR